MDLALPLNLPKEAEEQFLPLPDSEKQSVLTELLIDWADKQARKKRRQELLDNPSPIVAKWAGAFAKADGSQWTDEEIAKAKDDYITQKYGM